MSSEVETSLTVNDWRSLDFARDDRVFDGWPLFGCLLWNATASPRASPWPAFAGSTGAIAAESARAAAGRTLKASVLEAPNPKSQAPTQNRRYLSTAQIFSIEQGTARPAHAGGGVGKWAETAHATAHSVQV